MRIAFCVDQIDNIGGVERVTVAKANSLSDIEGNEVFIIVAFHRRDNDSIILDPKVRLIDLGIHYYRNYGYNRIKGILIYFKLKYEHRKRLKNVLNNLLPDIVVSVGGIDRLFLPNINIISNPVLIREMHANKYVRRNSAKTFIDKVAGFTSEYIDYNCLINKYDCVTVLTQEDFNDNWKNNHNVIVIPNPIIENDNVVSSLNHKIVVSAGRLVETKNFTSLISAWRYVHKSFPDWKLKIYGDGPLRSNLQKQIENGNLLDSIELCGFASDLHSKLKLGSIFVFTSITEGFGLVLIEAMGHGLPVVSYDCPYGPKDIIDQGKNGFYVPLNDEKKLADKIILLISDKNKREEFGRNAYVKSKYYSMKRIISIWMSTYEKLIKEKRHS